MGLGYVALSQNPYAIYDRNNYVIFPTLFMKTKKFEILFMIVATGTVALSIIFEGLSSMVLSIMKKKYF